MIENSKQQQLTFDKGITNVPSDAVCSDNALEDCVGLVYDNGEHRVIQRPEEFITSVTFQGSHVHDISEITLKLLYVHRLNDEERYIVGLSSSPNATTLSTALGIKSGTNLDFIGNGINGHTVTDSTKVTSIGKTLIISDDSGIYYHLWTRDDKGNPTYKYLGNKIPEPEVEFAMVSGNWGTSIRNHLTLSAILEAGGCLEFIDATMPSGKSPHVVNQADYNNLVVGLYNKAIKMAADKRCFAKPFLLRYAIELYDGSYVCQSAPVAMFPAITKNCEAYYYNDKKEVWLYIYPSLIAFKAYFDYTDWQDVIKGVTVFASDGVEIYDTSSDQQPKRVVSGTVTCNRIINPTGTGTSPSSFKEHSSAFDKKDYSSAEDYHFSPLNSLEESEILENLQSTSVFYKLFEIGLKGSGKWESSRGYIKSHVIENLTTQEQLTDDYYSHTVLTGKSIMAYNNRLLLSNVKRSFYEGASSFLPYDNQKSYDYTVYIYIKTPGGDRVVRKQLTTYEKIGIYFFYPDPRAYKAVVFVGGAFLCTMELKEHPYLNGAYFFDKLPDGKEGEPSGQAGGQPEPDVSDQPEQMTNQIWTSEVNNPFVFRAEGNVSIGSGSIVGMSSLTQALSQGQFGQYPLIVFTDEGIWAASTGSTGLFTAVHPMSREVCNNPDSVTQTDCAVFFSSAKGLMVVAGSTVKCVSEQLAGRSDTPFTEFIRNAVLAYDYRDSLLWVFSKSGARHAYVYAIRSGTFSRYDFGAAQVTNVVNAYPDYLLQSGNTVYSLMRRANINTDPSAYAATIVTRPMKLENGLALKSLIQVIHIHDMQGRFVIRIYVSNDLKHWAEIHSLRGTPWKYYRIRYEFTDLRATDRFAGTVIVTHESRTNKLR